VDAVNRDMERYSREAINVGYIDLNPVLFDYEKKSAGEFVSA